MFQPSTESPDAALQKEVTSVQSFIFQLFLKQSSSKRKKAHRLLEIRAFL